MFVYLVRCQEFSKIGVATDMVMRVAEMQVGNPYPLLLWDAYEMEHAIPTETELHQFFDDKWTRGEWFKLNDDDFSEFKRICESNSGKSAKDVYYKALKLKRAEKQIIRARDARKADVIQLLGMCVHYNSLRHKKDTGIIYDSSRLRVHPDWRTPSVDILKRYDLAKDIEDGMSRVTGGYRKVYTLLEDIQNKVIVIKP